MALHERWLWYRLFLYGRNCPISCGKRYAREFVLCGKSIYAVSARKDAPCPCHSLHLFPKCMVELVRCEPFRTQIAEMILPFLCFPRLALPFIVSLSLLFASHTCKNLLFLSHKTSFFFLLSYTYPTQPWKTLNRFAWLGTWIFLKSKSSVLMGRTLSTGKTSNKSFLALSMSRKAKWSSLCREIRIEIGNEKNATVEPIRVWDETSKDSLVELIFFYVDLVESCLTALSITPV